MLGTKPVNSPRLANAHEGAIAHHICKKASYKALIMVTSCNWIQGADFDPRKDRIKITWFAAKCNAWSFLFKSENKHVQNVQPVETHLTNYTSN